MSRRDDPEVMAELARWRDALRAELGVDELPCDTDEILHLAFVVSRQVVRPAVPVTAYIVGLATGMAMASGEDPQAAARRAFDVATNPQALEY